MPWENDPEFINISDSPILLDSSEPGDIVNAASSLVRNTFDVRQLNGFNLWVNAFGGLAAYQTVIIQLEWLESQDAFAKTLHRDTIEVYVEDGVVTNIGDTVWSGSHKGPYLRVTFTNTHAANVAFVNYRLYGSTRELEPALSSLGIQGANQTALGTEGTLIGSSGINVPALGNVTVAGQIGFGRVRAIMFVNTAGTGVFDFFFGSGSNAESYTQVGVGIQRVEFILPKRMPRCRITHTAGANITSAGVWLFRELLK